MRLKTFTAKTTTKAMDLVRKELGDEAIIISTIEDKQGGCVRVVAAQEEIDHGALLTSLPKNNKESFITLESICACLDHHSVPSDLRKRIISSLPDTIHQEALAPLADALRDCFFFKDFSLEKQKKPLLLVGPPGVGKTASIAKLSAQAKASGRSLHLMTADTIKVGSIEQIETFASALGEDLHIIDKISHLDEAVDVAASGDLVLIDTPGVNPFDDREMITVAELITASGGEGVLVMAAGNDPLDSAEMAHNFAQIGVESMIVTKLDLAHRYGNVLAASKHLTPALYSASPKIVSRLSALKPDVMAGLLLESSVCAETKNWQSFLELVA